MALFGEYNITNNIDLSITLESLVKSLGIGLEDDFSVADLGITSILFSKTLSDSLDTPSDTRITVVVSKELTDSLDTPSDSFRNLFGKTLSDTYSGISDATTSFVIGKTLQDTTVGTWTDSISRTTTKVFTDASTISDSSVNSITKYVEDTSIGTLAEEGKVWLNSYQAQDYYSEEYSVGLEETFTS